MKEKDEIERKRRIMEESIAILRNKFESDVALLTQTKIEKQLKEVSKKVDKMEIVDLRNKIRSSVEKSKARNN